MNDKPSGKIKRAWERQATCEKARVTDKNVWSAGSVFIRDHPTVRS